MTKEKRAAVWAACKVHSAGVTEQTGEGQYTITERIPPFSRESPPYTYLVRRAHHQRKDVSQCQRLVKRKGIIYLKVIQT